MKWLATIMGLLLAYIPNTALAEPPASAPHRSATPNGWLHLGIGLSNVGSRKDGFVVGGGGAFHSGRHLFSIRALWGAENRGYFHGPPREKVRETGLLYGLAFHRKGGLVGLSGSVGWVDGVQYRRGRFLRHVIPEGGMFSYPTEYDLYEYDRLSLKGLEIPIAVDLWAQMQSFGVGFYAFTSLLSEYPFSGGLLSIQLGKLQ